MRTVLDVDRDLLEKARRALRQPSLTATVNEALRLVIERQREALRELREEVVDMDEESRFAMAGARERQW